ncbi:MAG: hypothetical protein RI897_1054 [Verrucomicrobiota bacterium]|jgi:outer membrane protein assembly factor BamE (lipoprotein component of BamABCDE complex)
MSNNTLEQTFLPLACALTLLFTASSCSQTTGLKMSGERIAFIHDGTTTRKEVVETLGTPLYDLPPEQMIAYSWVTSTAMASRSLAGSPGEVSIQSDQSLFCLRFDQQDIVQHHGRLKVRGNESAEDAMRRWLAEIGETPAKAQP